MTYAARRDSLLRTRQDLLVIGVRECQNHYATIVEQLLTYTEQMDNAAWTKTSVTVSADDAAAPDGFTTADTVSFNATSDSLAQTVTGTAVTSSGFTGSVWLRVASSSNTVSIKVRNVADTESTAVQCTVTTTWTRFWVNKLFSGTPVDDVVFEVIRTASDDVGDMEVWGANLWQNPNDEDAVVRFPYRKRVAEAVATVSVNASRCSISDAGDGARCYYSRPTCQDGDNFNAGNTYETDTRGQGIREFRFCRQNAALPLPGQDVMPYLVTAPMAAQEIDAERALTVNERVTFEFEDDASPGLWNPRQSYEGALVNSAVTAGTFWRRWIPIYRNYSNPEGYATRKIGYVEAGMTESDFQTRGKYIIQNVETNDKRIKLICSDRLKLTRTQIPAKISDTNQIALNLTSSGTSLVVDDATEITPVGTGYTVVLELEPDTANAEKVNVTAIDLDTNTCTIQRGRWGTTAVKHNRDQPFREVAEFGTERTTTTLTPLGKNAVDIMIELYRYAGLTADEIDSTTLESERDIWLPSVIDTSTGYSYGPLLRRTVTETVEIEKLAREIRDLTLMFMWVNDSQQLTGKVYAPRRPTETVTTWTDGANFIAGSLAIDHNNESRISRAVIAWNLTDGADAGDIQNYQQVRVELNIDLEEREYYGDKPIKVLLSQWIKDFTTESGLGQRTASGVAADFTRHILDRFGNGTRILTGKVEIKDDDIGLGAYVLVQTDDILDEHGDQATLEMMVTKKKYVSDNVIQVELVDTGIFRRYWFYAPDGQADYGSATATEKQYGYYSDDNGFTGTRDPGYVAW